MNENYAGRYAEQLEFAKRAVQAAEDPATRGAASLWLAIGWTVYDADRIEEVVAAGLRDLPEDAFWTRTMLTGMRAHAAIAQGRYHDAIAQLEAQTDMPDPFPTTELMVTRHLVGDDPTAGLGDVRARVQGSPWSYRVPLVDALTAAATGDHRAAAAAVLAAAHEAEARQLWMFDQDVLVGCAAAAYHRGDLERASRLLAVVGGWTRSPGTYALYRRYRDRVREELPAERGREIVASSRGRDVVEVLEEELTDLRMLARGAPEPA